MLSNYLSLIKFSHTIFALPFALCGAFLGFYDVGDINYSLLLKVIICMITARSSAMAFNRYLDREFDSKNPRTATREIPSGIISAHGALIFTLLNIGLFILTTYFINATCFLLSPIALIIILGYSYTKRFTALCHLVLGLGLALAPVGSYLAITDQWSWISILMGATVLTWVTGFDIVYALQDQEFDRSNNLNSIPVVLGTKSSLLVARVLHTVTALTLIATMGLAYSNYPALGWVAGLGSFVFIIMLLKQHMIVKMGDLSRINLAFFTTNGIASLVFGLALIFDLIA
jgi:4-hydroxybenzoate polyprenyltransferase